MAQTKKPNRNPSRVFSPIFNLPILRPAKPATVSPILIKINDKIAIFFGKMRIVTKAEIITHDAPVNAPSSSCFLIILLKNKLIILDNASSHRN